MRLRLVIQRQALPPVQILWTTGAHGLPVDSNFTISQFLEQISEIIPLESEDWGLEDYAVEVRGFECLHFSELNRILKEDDEVSIRPLQTSDLRFRKISGRHQISASGKHLIDGVAFGRPFLRRGDRPAIRIPPRKRRRITYGDNDEDGSEEEEGEEDEDEDYAFNDFTDSHQLVVQARSNDAVNIFDEHDTEDDGDNSDSEDVVDDLNAELEELRNETRNHAGHDILASAESTERTLDPNGTLENSPKITRSRSRRGLGLEGPAMIELLDENGRPYPGEYNNPLLDFYGADESQHYPDETTAKPRGERAIHRRRKSCLASKATAASSEHVSRRSSSASVKGVRFDETDIMTPATILGVEDTDRSDDENFRPTDDAVLAQHDSDKENSQPLQKRAEEIADIHHSSNPSSSSSSKLEIDSDETFSDLSSSSLSSDSESERLQCAPGALARDSETSSSGSSSSSDSSDSEAEDTLQNLENGELAGVTSTTNHVEQALTPESVVAIGTKESPKSVAPYEGKLKTQKRNQRRRDNKRLVHLKTIGILPPSATVLDLRKMKANNRTVTEDCYKQSGDVQKESSDSHSAIEAKKKHLLEALDLGGSGSPESFGKEKPEQGKEDGHKLADNDTVGTNDVVSPSIGDEARAMESIQRSQIGDVPDWEPGQDEPENLEAPSNSATIEPPKRRPKLDLPSSRRLLFSSLGLRTPKSKDDELKLKEKLTMEVTRIQPPQREEAEAHDALVRDTAEDYDSWKGKIILKAVECCHDGIKLSTPPFPFVQRWDPQQQINHFGGDGSYRSKKRKRNESQYNQTRSKSRRKLNRKMDERQLSLSADADSHWVEEEDGAGALVQQNGSHGDSDEYEAAINDQLMRETDASVSACADVGGVQDLPCLPENISSFPTLTEDTVKPGTVVAFKQLDMSEETNWQPRVSDYRMAIVECLTVDGTLRMILAKREKSVKGERFDQRTGERIYSKFEMPGFEEDVHGDGMVEISFSELIEPKLIQSANSDLVWERSPQQSIKLDDQSREENGVALVHDTHNLPLDSQSLREEPAKEDAGHGKRNEATEEVRQEIFDLIKEAGWRSSVRSNNEEVELSQQELLGSKEETDENQNIVRNSFSPQDKRFSSSPPAQDAQEMEMEPVSSRGLSAAPASPSVHEFEIAESLPAQRISFSKSPRKELCTIPEDDKVKEEDKDEGSLWDKPQHKQNLSVDHQISSQELPTQDSPHQLTNRVSRSRNRSQEQKSSGSLNIPLENTSSDNEFPALENVFSQVRSSQQQSITGNPLNDSEMTYMEETSFASTTSKTIESQKPPSQRLSKENLSQKRTPFPQRGDSPNDEDSQTTPRASQAATQSQIVDLTLSSDPPEPIDDSDYVDETQLPEGPGWVQKARRGIGRFDGLRAGSGRSSRSRSRGVC